MNWYQKISQTGRVQPNSPNTAHLNWYRRIFAAAPWEMTEDEFVKHHNTGYIPSNAYKDYETSEGISFIAKANYPVLLQTLTINNVLVEVRRSNRPLQYVKQDENGEIMRDERGMALYQTEEEMKAAGRQTVEADLGAFVGETPIGFASNEFGSAGVWVVKDFQRQGLGTLLLKTFMALNPQIKHIGQMTNAGMNMTRSYHRSLVQDNQNAQVKEKPITPIVPPAPDVQAASWYSHMVRY